jgi:hypothetical protein
MTKIITDNKWKNFKYRNEVPKSVLSDEFHYQDDDVGDGYIFYNHNWYHIDQFMRLSGTHPFHGWEAYSGDSFFSGVVIKVSKDGEQYMIGRYYS